ncbi:MAG: hypothetical protein M1840_007539 [Geoglossum simile]|nr:MAG: hypothetical protein M1840_007539 [Geoglossum simile]
MIKRGIQGVLSSNPAAEFVKSPQMVDEFGDAISSPTQFRVAQDQFVAQHIVPDYYNESNEQMYRLEKSIARLEKVAMEKGIDISKKEDGSYTMGDVLNVVGEIQKSHSTPPGTMGKIRTFFRGVGKEAPVMQQWIKCFPQDAYGSAICGGFTIILSAAARLDTLRNEIYSALADIPFKLEKIYRYNAAYQTDKLHFYAAGVYVAIFVVLEYIMVEMLEKPRAKFGRSVIKGSNYGAEINERLKELEKSVSVFNEEARLCADERLGEVRDCVGRMEKDLNETREKLLENAGRILENQENQGRDLESLRLSMERHQQPMTESEFKHLYLSLKVQNTIYVQLTSSPNFDNRSGLLAPPNPYLFPHSAHKTAPQDRWLNALQYSPEAVPNDIEECLRALRNFSLHQQDQVTWIMTSEEMRSWLRCGESRILMIECESRTAERDSPLSYTSAMLAQSLSSSADFPILRFFCGMHTDEDSDGLSGVSGMLKSLIGQLLEFTTRDDEPVDLGFLKSLSSKRYLKDVRSLVDLFTQITNQLPESWAVFCIVDSISWLDEPRWEQDTRVALEGLVSLMDNPRVVFKLLFTDPHSLEVPGAHRSDTLFVPEYVDGNRMGTNSEYLDSSTRSDLSEFTPSTTEDSESEYW